MQYIDCIHLGMKISSSVFGTGLWLRTRWIMFFFCTKKSHSKRFTKQIQRGCGYNSYLCNQRRKWDIPAEREHKLFGRTLQQRENRFYPRNELSNLLHYFSKTRASSGEKFSRSMGSQPNVIFFMNIWLTEGRLITLHLWKNEFNFHLLTSPIPFV